VIILSDSQTDAIASAIKPMQPGERQALLAQLFEELIYRHDEIGDGSLARLLRDLQKKYFVPPDTEEVGWGARWPRL
jgi:hypothetical protein